VTCPSAFRRRLPDALRQHQKVLPEQAASRCCEKAEEPGPSTGPFETLRLTLPITSGKHPTVEPHARPARARRVCFALKFKGEAVTKEKADKCRRKRSY